MLEVKNITREYRPKKGVPVRALDDVSIKFPERGLVFILGKSGSGKSTLLNVMGGLDKIDCGEIIIKGKSSKDFSQSDFDSYRNTYLGFIFQEYNILDEFTVGANIALALELQGKKATNEVINEILEEVDLVGYAKRKPNELSGGQKQRVAIARALVKNPEIIMADEPTGALDSNTGIQVFDTLKKLSAQKLVIVVSHDREFAEMYGDRVIEFKDGKIISDIEKYAESAESVSDGISVVDNKILSIKKGYRLTARDLDMINNYLTEHDAIVSVDESANRDFRKAARIDENMNREAFKETDESKIAYSDNASAFKLIRSRLPWKNSLKIGASALKTKPFRLFMTILLSCLAFAMFGFVDTLSAYDITKTVSDGLQNRTHASGVLSYEKKYGEGMSQWYRDYHTDDDTRALIKDTYGVETDGLLQNEFGFERILNDKSSLQGGVNFFNTNPYGAAYVPESRLAKMGYSMEGRYPESANEIALTDYHVALFDKTGALIGDELVEAGQVTADKLLGKTISLGYGDHEAFTVTGIIRTRLALDASSRYARFMESNNYELGSLKGEDKTLSMQMMYEVWRAYPAVLYVSQAYIDEKDDPKQGIDIYNMDDAGFICDLRGELDENGNETYLSANRFNKLSNVEDKVLYFGEEKTALADDEVVVYSPMYESGDWSKIEIQAGDRERVVYNGHWDSESNELVVRKETSEIYDFGELWWNIPGEALWDYAAKNLPEDKNFDAYVRRYYASRSEYGYKPFEGIPTQEMRTYAYYRFLMGEAPYDPELYGEDLVEAYRNWERESYRATTNFFGGKKQESFMLEHRIDLFDRYDELLPSAPIQYTGEFGLYRYDGEGEKPTVKTVKVVGCVFTADNYEVGGTMIVSDRIYDEVAQYRHKPYAALLFDTNQSPSGTQALIESTYDEESPYRFVFANEVQESMIMVHTLLTMFVRIFLYVGIGFAVFSGLLLMNFISTSIAYKKREIGILRAVGAKPSDVFGIFFNEAFIIAVINFGLALVLTIGAVIFMNGYMMSALGILGSLLVFGIRQIALMLGLSVAVAFVASFLPVYRIAKKRPVDAIRNK